MRDPESDAEVGQGTIGKKRAIYILLPLVHGVCPGEIKYRIWHNDPGQTGNSKCG